ncbi:cse1l [Symbiodinium pilosum]|uniref:Cse1l protein n=1 Tax=Symbiodinium pilosum TaxID=2952 RepID=A0A812VZE6_SYMPI|nr:cse1l [Symbiodinium pilosum]
MAANPAQMGQLTQLLTQTVAGNMEVMKAAEQQLRAAEVQSGFGLVLLELLRSGSVEAAARQAGAIYFKNYIRRQWCIEGAGGIAASDRQAIKQHILSLMLQAPKQVQVQLSAGLEEISITDYPAEWQSLLPEIVQHLKTSQDMSVLKGTMQTAHTVFLKFRAQARSEDLLREVKYTVEGFQETHLAVFKASCGQVLQGNLPPDQLIAHFELLLATTGAFYSLNVIDLPEFFEDHREEYFRGFLDLLKFQHEAVAGKDQQGLLEQVKGAVCECLVLYAEKYQEEFMPFLLPCVQEVWSLLVGLDQQEKNDQLVAKGIQFLSSTAATQWPQSPFEDPNVLSGICEKVVFPNVLLRDSDIELFEDNPLEYVRRDMEAADQETRRRSSMDLVKAMGRLNEAKVTEILIGYVKALMEKAASAGAGQAERFKDACIFLCIAMAVREQTHREGVTVTNQNVNVLHFFTSLVAPELTAEPLSQRSVLRASCLKFVTVFRNQLPREQVGQVLPAVCRHITSESPVVHTYAAICIEKLLRVRDATPQGQLMPRYDPPSMKGQLLQMVQPILQIIASNKGIPMNEYLMRTVARIFSFLKQQGSESGLATLSPLSAILLAMSANPSNPVFNHCLFEAVASIVKVCVPAQPDAVESALLPTFGQILERNVVDFLPYTFQIMGLLLDASPSIKPLYTELFARLLTPELWRSQANVPGLIRLLRAYFAKHAGFAELLRTHMQAILERFQFVLMNRKTEVAALDLLNAMYQYLPIEFYQQFLKTLMTVLLTRLQSSKSPKFKRDFVVSCSLCIHKNQSVIPLFNEIQAGLLSNLMLNIWPPVLKMPLRTDERKVCVMAVAKLLSLDELRQNTQLVATCAVGIVHLLGLSSSNNKSKLNGDDGSDDEPLENGGAGQEYEVSFNKLQNTDLPGAAAGLAPDVPELQSAAKAALKPVLGRQQALVEFVEEAEVVVEDDFGIVLPCRYGVEEELLTMMCSAGELPSSARGTILTEPMLEQVMESACSQISRWNPEEWKSIATLQEAGKNRASVGSVERKTDHLALAVKRLPNRWMKKRHREFAESNPQSSEKPWVDIGMLRYLNALGFPHVCDLMGIFRDDDFTYVATVLATEGDLFHWVEQATCSPGRERESIIRPMVAQVFSAVKELHELGIAHRDISLENLLLTQGPDGGPQIKVIDFGMATLSQRCSAEVRGKQAYQAPEMHTDIEYDAFLADIFAAGVVLYAMALSDYPWTCTRSGSCGMYDFIHSWGFQEFIKYRKCRAASKTYIVQVLSPSLCELMEGLLELHPEERFCLGESCFDARGANGRWSVWDMAWMQRAPRETCTLC